MVLLSISCIKFKKYNNNKEDAFSLRFFEVILTINQIKSFFKAIEITFGLF